MQINHFGIIEKTINTDDINYIGYGIVAHTTISSSNAKFVEDITPDKELISDIVNLFNECDMPIDNLKLAVKCLFT